ncbi:hypothetical protein [Streptomyces abyssalis]|uniref:hypothetical protein n=1 Tax=Streptomyces abyssalis TaxID=933944 RepID=UPI001112F45D|nr:hypothetical protein [Streptomyces abyssalis]
MNREELRLMLVSHGDEPASRCAEALASGSPFTVWEETTDTNRVASIYARREKHNRRIQQPSIGFTQAMHALKEFDEEELRIGYVDDRERGGFYFQLFLDAEAIKVIACLGVRPSAREQPPNTADS